MELLDHRTYYRALQSHDARFDGHVFVGCTSTGIYCRPICPTRPPKFENCRFFASAAAAQEAGFRPCLRCRPEIAPDLAFWRGTANTVSRALALIADGALDGEHSDVEALAGRLGVGGRQLRRLFQRHLGASPIAVAQTRRVLFAKQLLHDTRLPMTEVARVRRVFYLGADIATIDSHLARDPRLAPLIRKRPGLRAPGDWESETVLGAQDDTPSAWRPWHAYAAQHLRMASHG